MITTRSGSLVSVIVPMLIGIVALFISGCQDLGNEWDFHDVAGVRIEVRESRLSVTNNTIDTIRYFAVERETAAVINWRPSCSDTNTIIMKKTKEIPYTKILGYYPNSELIFYWWHCVESSSGGSRPDVVRSGVVATK